MDATGIWHGEYRYELDDGGSSVTFTMRLTQDAAGHLSGTVNDGPGGMPEEGRIVGECRRERLRFLKLMPVARVGTGDGTQDIAAFLVDAGYEVDGAVEHPQLLYEGRLAADGQAVAGTWRLDGHIVPLKDGRSVRTPGARGVWSARRADP